MFQEYMVIINFVIRANASAYHYDCIAKSLQMIAKSTSSLWRLRTHVTGAVLHTKASYAKLVYCFVDLAQYPHDSNFTLKVIVNVLVDFAKTYQFPKVLYLQMDNTCRENKNRLVLTFCAALVHLQNSKK